MDAFTEYVNRYNMDDINISYKYHHSYRVRDNMVVLAKSMQLPMCDVKLAECIGILHDIGRFEQLKRFNSFSDYNIDHGDLACEVIKEEALLPKYGIDKDDYDVAYKAIRYHNKFKIPDDLNKREKLFAKMIRDADKLDIIYAFGSGRLKEIVKQNDSAISKRISDAFFEERDIERTKNDTDNDNLVVIFALAYDINFGLTLQIIKENDYYNKIYDQIKNKEMFKPYIEKINSYINERTD